MDPAAAAVLALGVSMDAFAASVCKGLSARRADGRAMAACGFWFGGFQALMPVAGFFLGSLFAGAVAEFDHLAAFFLLALIGTDQILDAFSGETAENGDFSPKTMAWMALATSVDALAVGISLAMAGNVRIFPAAALIGVTTGCLSAAGVKLGSFFGSRLQQRARLAGGLMLMGLGIWILWSHLGGKG